MDKSQIEDIFPLTPMQTGLLFQALYDTGSPAYFLQMTLDWRGELRPDWLRESWQILSARHPALRSLFVYEGVKRPYQVALKQRPPLITLTDLRYLPAEEQTAAIAHYQTTDQAHGFDLRQDVLLRLAVFQLGEQLFRLVWSYHHILFDGWSFGILQQEFITIYRALQQGKRPSLPPVPAYKQYIHWLQAQNRETAVTYWRDYLAGYTQLATLPRLRPPGTAPQPEQQTWVIAETVTQQIQTTANQCGVTLNSLIRAVWSLLLARYNNRDDVLFGAIVSGRPSVLPGVEEMIGLFINAVPVRAKLAPDIPFAQLARRLQQDGLAGEPYHYLPLAEIQTLNPLGRGLFDHLLTFENYPLAEAAAAEPDTFTLEMGLVHDRTHYDLSIVVTPGRQLVIQFQYNQAVYTPAQVARLILHWQTAITAILEDPHRPVDQIPVLPAAEQRQLLVEFNDTARDYPTDLCLHQLFEQQVARTPKNTAVKFRDQSLTYDQLNRRANQLAHYLQSQGVGPEVKVVLCLERSLEMVIAMYGVLKAGGAYVPLDPAYPPERLRFLLADAQTPILLTQTHLLSLLPETETAVLPLDTAAWLPAQPDHNPRPTASPANLAYMIYTSGSTGLPKGVLITHASIVNQMLWLQETYQLDDSDRILQKTPYSFDASVWQFYWTLFTGGQLIMAEPDRENDNQYLIETIIARQITTIQFVPSLLSRFVQTPGVSGCTSLRRIMIGGEAMSYPLQEQCFAHLTADLHNLYGPTETTIQVAYWQCIPGDKRGFVSIGRPVANTQLYIVDDHNRPVPIGVTGELLVGGIQVGRGYWQREELTELRFTQDELRNIDPSFVIRNSSLVLYKTGDLARWHEDGTIEYLGRRDNQVKLRGVRIELGEIEAQLLQIAAVETAVVLLKEEQLVAYLVGQPLSTAELRHRLRQQLPEALVPAQFTWLDEIPLTPNGKTDRNRLQQREDGTVVTTAVYHPPRTQIERQLADIWAEVLGVERVGIEDSFFDLGGHSLKAMQTVSRIHQAFDVKISLRDYFGRPTIAQQARLIARSETDSYAAIRPAAPRDHYPLSHAQKRLWLEHQLDKTGAYNMPAAYLIEDQLDVDALEQTFGDIIRRHEALRTAFVLVDGEPVQQILPDVPFTLRRLDLSGEPDGESRAQTIINEAANRPFDLTRPPLLRALVIILAERRHIFALTIHHIIGDGWSGRVLYREIMALYRAHRQQQPHPLPPLRIQYKDFTLWQLARDFAEAEAYWLKRLAGVPDYLPLPADFPAPSVRNFRGGMEQVVLNGRIPPTLRALAQQAQTTLANVILALFKLLLYQLTRQTDLCLGVASANRNHPDLENLLGFFVNILPLRTQMSDEMEFIDLLAQVTEGMNEAFAHQDYPFDLLVEKLNPTRHANRPPIVNVMYGFQSFGDVTIDGQQVPIAETDNLAAFDVNFQTAKFDLTLFVLAETKTITLTLEYDSSLFKPETIRRYLGAMGRFAGMVGERVEGKSEKEEGRGMREDETF